MKTSPKKIVFSMVLFLTIFSLWSYITMDDTKELAQFYIKNPPPQCSNWREHMPKTRDAEIYKIYINARKLWRSTPPWRLEKREAESILHSVSYASEKGDWGARALMEHFFIYGLGTDDANRVLEPNPQKAINIMRLAVSAGIPFGYFDLGTAYENGYGNIKKDKKPRGLIT